MENYSINYIACFYIGDKRGYAHYVEKFKTDPFYFVKKHLDFLSECNNHIKCATLVFNDDLDEVLKSYLSKISLPNMKVEVVFRKNSAFSYGAWSDAILKNLMDYDYFFLIEDDYIPLAPNFYEYFVEKSSYEFPYVCQYVDAGYTTETPYHPSISNGILRADVCREIVNKYGYLFRLSQGTGYQIGWDNQVSFYRTFVESGFGALDILDKYCSPFAYPNRNPPIQVFGNPELPALIYPIEVV